MLDTQLSQHNLAEVLDQLQREVIDHKIVIIKTQKADTGKWAMARLWRKWMATVSQWMAANGSIMPLMIKPCGEFVGKRAFNAEDAHELFSKYFLMSDEKGVRLSWSKKGRDGMRAATQGERFNALRLMEDWAINKGIVLFKPVDSEYTKLNDEQNK